MDNTKNEKIAELEALLFQYGNPIQRKKISSLMNVSENVCEECIQALREALEERGSGLQVIANAGSVQLATRADFSSMGERIMKEELKEELTPAALEALSLIAYLGPVPRSTIDFIRGVNSSFILRNLLVRGLIEREPSKEKKNVYMYRTTFAFLEHMGISDVAELPEYEKYQTILHDFESGKEDEEKESETEEHREDHA